ncbi:MAG: prepilin-type N-terminal cleavage/methylation domain-containing protein [Candidatus Hydrogenedentes bacterium]|nr:prepilin-type N-terminal cleavage/methylation domain-containing protein [Candidatus Hydrogenedentota bacterium]
MASRQNRWRTGRRKAPGFTLVELLVAMAIMSLLILALFVLFRSSLISYKSTKRAMDASDATRTAFQVMERDIVQGYASKHYGDAASFFGCPFGFSMIATIDAAGQAQTARVSYVVHSFAGRKIVDAMYAPGEGDPEGYVDLPTYGIVRYIEPGVDTLSAYPVDWPDYTDASGPIEGTERNLWEGLREIYVKFGPDSSASLTLSDGTPVFNIEPVSPTKFQAMIEAKKHELWLAMLGDRIEPFGQLPDLWSDLGKVPEDYVIAEGVLATAPGPVPDITQVQWFKYGYTKGEVNGKHAAQLGRIHMIPYWHAVDTANLGTAGDVNFPFINNYGSPLYPFPPSLVAVNMDLAFPAPNLGEHHLVRKLSQAFEVPVGYRRPLMAVE